MLSVPEPGTICVVNGVLSEPAPHARSEVDLTFYLSRRDNTQTCILSPFEARGLDITALQFDLDRVPDAWFAVALSVIQQTQCDEPSDCTKDGIYDWLTPDHQEIVSLHPGTILVPFDELVGDSLTGRVDEHWISHIEFDAIAGSGPIPFEYCVSNIKFLNSLGQEVIPPPLE